jgi:hypothetical protein
VSDSTVRDESDTLSLSEAVPSDGSPVVAPGATDLTVTAQLRGGPAAGRRVEVPRVAGSYPMFLGVDGANYVRDKGAGDVPVYNWWPAGASGPAGDPSARSDNR